MINLYRLNFIYKTKQTYKQEKNKNKTKQKQKQKTKQKQNRQTKQKKKLIVEGLSVVQCYKAPRAVSSAGGTLLNNPLIDSCALYIHS